MDKLYLAFLLSCACFAQPPSPTPSKAADRDQKETDRKRHIGTDNNGDVNSIVTAINRLTSEVKAGGNQRPAEQKQGGPPSEGWAKWSTIATAAATLAIAILGAFQWWAMNKQRSAMELQATYMKSALDETTKAANAAKSSADTAALQRGIMDSQAGYMRDALAESKRAADAARISAEGLVSSERAWVLLEGIKSQTFQPGIIRFSFKNHGRTPAWLIDYRIAYVRNRFEEPSAGLLSSLTPIDYRGILVGDEVTPEFSATIDDQMGNEIATPWTHIYGAVRYRDISRRIRKTTFCLTFEGLRRDGSGFWHESGPPKANRNT